MAGRSSAGETSADVVCVTGAARPVSTGLWRSGTNNASAGLKPHLHGALSRSFFFLAITFTRSSARILAQKLCIPAFQQGKLGAKKIAEENPFLKAFLGEEAPRKYGRCLKPGEPASLPRRHLAAHVRTSIRA